MSLHSKTHQQDPVPRSSSMTSLQFPPGSSHFSIGLTKDTAVACDDAICHEKAEWMHINRPFRYENWTSRGIRGVKGKGCFYIKSNDQSISSIYCSGYSYRYICQSECPKRGGIADIFYGMHNRREMRVIISVVCSSHDLNFTNAIEPTQTIWQLHLNMR